MRYIVKIGSKTTSLKIATVQKASRMEDKNGFPVYVDETERDLALTLACERFYGKGAFFWKDSGVNGFGQVCKPCRYGNGNDCVTSTVNYSVMEV